MPQHTAQPQVLDIAGYAKTTLAVSGTAAQTSVLGVGVYALWCPTLDVHVKVAETADDVTTGSGFTIFAGNMVPVAVPIGAKIGAITDGGSGSLYIFRVS